MKESTKLTLEGLFYFLGSIGIIDMFIQAVTEGKIKPIRMLLQWVFL